MARRLVVFFVACFLTVSQVHAQSQATNPPAKEKQQGSPRATQSEKKDFALIVDEKEVIIDGWYGAGGNYSGSVRLTAKTRKGLQPSFLSYDLTREKDGMKLDRQNVTIDGEIRLSLGTPKNIKIRVTGIEEPGTYKGIIEFRPQGADLGQTLDLIVTAKATQPLTPLPGTDQIKLHLTSGTWSKFLPTAETIDSRELQFENRFRLPVKLLKADFVLFGDQTGYQLVSPIVKVKKNDNHGGQTGRQITSAPVGVKKDDNQPPNPVVKLTLTLNRDKIPPDKYTGSIILWFEGAKEALQLPVVELTMRHGPFQAFVILVVGIFIGWFLLYMKSEGLVLAKILRDLDYLKNQISELEIGDQWILETMLERVEWQISQKKLEDAKGTLENIKYRLQLLKELERIEGGLIQPIGDDILDIIESIRVAVVQGKDKDANDSLIKLSELALSHKQAAVPNLIKAMQAQKMALAVQQPSPLTFRTGFADIKYWKQFFRNNYLLLLKWLGPLIYYLITCLILVVVGLITLYMKNMTFGASPLVDYIGLILWGLGTDVASRNVANVLTAARLTPK